MPSEVLRKDDEIVTLPNIAADDSFVHVVKALSVQVQWV